MTIKITAPENTSGLAVEPWSAGDVYAVAAEWSQATAPVYTWSDEGWISSPWQVANFGGPVEALERVLSDAARDSGEPLDDADVIAIVANAVAI